MKTFVATTVVLALLAASACAKRPRPSISEPPAAPATPPPAPPPADVPASAPIDDEARLRSMSAEALDRLGLLHDIHFDFDRADIRDDARPLLARNAEVLRRYDFLYVTLQGHCDARGTVEYNLALGDRRAQAAHEYLVSLGVPADRIRTASYGKEAPVCSEATEDCWQRNRRASPTISGTTTGR